MNRFELKANTINSIYACSIKAVCIIVMTSAEMPIIESVKPIISKNVFSKRMFLCVIPYGPLVYLPIIHLYQTLDLSIMKNHIVTARHLISICLNVFVIIKQQSQCKVRLRF